mmetsp:Transcript_64045/g.152741  ORF Transcript_64045/g.152741 Transcript_64045/m.152741 type:complete len:199 (-) Transcript_64045:89-685(-)
MAVPLVGMRLPLATAVVFIGQLLSAQALLLPATGGTAAATAKVAPVATRNVTCNEVTLGAGRIYAIVQDLDVLSKMYTDVLGACASGQFNLDCLVEASTASNPPAHLQECDERLGPHPTSSGAVCQFAKVKLGITDTFRTARIQLAQAMQYFARSRQCQEAPVPAECTESVDKCLQAEDPAHCFRECLRLTHIPCALQ